MGFHIKILTPTFPAKSEDVAILGPLPQDTMGWSCIAAAPFGGPGPFCLLFLSLCWRKDLSPYDRPRNNSELDKYRISSKNPSEMRNQLREYLCKTKMELGLISPSKICSKLSASGAVGSGWNKNYLPLRFSVLLNSRHRVRS